MIYFIEDPVKHLIKIGTTIRLSVRLAQLRAKHGPGLQVLGVTGGSYADERVLHDRFQLLRDDGEWFKAHEILTDFIDRESQPWDGTDEVPRNDVSVKIDNEAVRLARTVATYRNESLAEYLSRTVMEYASRDWGEIISKERETT